MEILYFPKEAAITCIPFMIDDTAVEEVRSFPNAMASLTRLWHTVPDNQRLPRIPRGWPRRKTTSVQSASSTTRPKGNSLLNRFRFIRSRRGTNSRILAVPAFIGTAIYHMLSVRTMYQDRGPNHPEYRTLEWEENRLVQCLDLAYALERVPLTA